jgi:hypothetical protein
VIASHPPSLDSPLNESSQDERHGKMLMHNEHSLLSLLKGEKGVIQMYDFFSEWCQHEEDIGGGRKVLIDMVKIKAGMG